MRPTRAACAFALAAVAGLAHAELLDFTPAEVRAILRHGPWPQPVLRDASNRVSARPEAIALGEALFFERRLSPSGAVSCARCHAPGKAWTDGRKVAAGIGDLHRNTPMLWNAGLGRWFGWDGGSDSLWSFSVRPILHPLEMGATPKHVAETLRADPQLACLYREVYGAAKEADERVLVNAAKAIAAFVETLVSGRTPFDEFRDALAQGDREAAARYPIAAQRGLRIFVGRGNCGFCHFGPAFTNGEFADIGVPFFVPGGVDPGRYGGIKRLLSDRFNLTGAHSDDGSGRTAAKTRHVHLQPRNFGEFKVPGLRNVALTAPYMHNGSLATLADVVKHYSELNEDRLHTEGEKILRPLKLSGEEAADLAAFLESLTDPGGARYQAGAPSRCATPRAR